MFAPKSVSMCVCTHVYVCVHIYDQTDYYFLLIFFVT